MTTVPSRNLLKIRLSVTVISGGESQMIISNFSLRIFIKSFILLEPRSSEGLGGRGPEGITLRFVSGLLKTILISEEAPARYVLNPLKLFSPNIV